MKAPFPWFGGKSRAAHLVWEAFGEVPNYVEPFAGSLAVLLGRPHAPRVETVNDIDCYLANFWRALAKAPEEVAAHADWPVNEADLHARHRWLVGQEQEAHALRAAIQEALLALGRGEVQAQEKVLRAALEASRVPQGQAFRERMRTDPEYFDAKFAGWWVWGISQWIGSGWCSAPEWEGRGHAGAPARGIHTQRARNLANTHEHGKRPVLKRGGTGVHSTAAVPLQKPDTSGSRGAAGRGVHAIGQRESGLLGWFSTLAERLRYVRVCCGDWRRVCTPATTVQIGVTGVMLDPPYAHEAGRDPSIYAHEEAELSARVREWALANGDNPQLRIALCGYEGEHSMPPEWRCVAWKAAGGYARDNQANARRERIWFSPHCLKPDRLQQASLLDTLEAAP